MRQKQTITIAAIGLLLSVNLYAGTKTNEISAQQFTQLLDNKVPTLLENYMVPGSAVAVIHHGKIIYQKGFGYADVKSQKPVDINTGFNIGSISKTVAAWGLMKLVEQGKIELDAPVEKYLTRWKLPKSEFDSKGVTVRRLLSHTAGLSLHGYPGWGPDDKLPTIEQSLNGKNNGPGAVELIMAPGTKWKYSGGGYTISQLLVEEVTGQDFSDFMREQILRPLGMKQSDYDISAKIKKASSTAYDQWMEPTPNPLFTAEAAAGLHVTIADFTRFAQANFDHGDKQPLGAKVLKPQSVKQMFEPVPASKGRWGIGYAINTMDDGKITVGHGGANRGWHAQFTIVPETQNGIMITTNSSNGWMVHRKITCDWAQWVTGVPAEDNCVSLKPISFTMTKLHKKHGIDTALKQYHQLKKHHKAEYDFAEQELNRFGYSLIANGHYQDAIKAFALNVELFPDSSNVYDSLGEGYMLNGDKALAIKNYQKSLDLDASNKHAVKMLEKLKNIN